MRGVLRIERHRLGPRVHVLGRRVHEYQLGLMILAVKPSRWATLLGLSLVVKDWPDLFPATRDRASWRLGVHRLPRSEVSR